MTDLKPYQTRLISAKSSQPQETAQDYFPSPASSTVNSGTSMDDPFISNNEITPRPLPQLKDPKDENSNTSTLQTLSKDTTPKICSTNEPKGPDDLSETQLATQSYGLPSPPDSTLVSHEPKRQDNTHVQSPPNTPTKVPASSNDEPLGLSIDESSDAPLRRAAEGIKSVVKFGTEDRVSSLQTFDFNFIPPSSRLPSSSLATSEPTPVKPTNFAAKFGSSKNATQTFKFELPSEAKALIGVLPSSSKPGTQDVPNSKAESEITNTVPKLVTAQHSSSISKRSGNLALDHTIDEDQRKTSEQLPMLPVPLQSLEIVTKQESATLKPASTSALIKSSLPLETLNQNPLPIFDMTSFPKPKSKLLRSPRSGSEKSSAFMFGSVSTSVTEKPILEASSLKKPRVLTDSVHGPFMFEFGSNFKAVPTSFDFDKWSRVPHTARTPHMSSTVWSSDRKSNDEIKGDGEEVEKNHIQKASLGINEKVEEPTGGKLIEKPATSVKHDSATDNYERERHPQPLKTPPRRAVQLFEGPMTPEATPEPSQSEKATAVSVEGSQTAEDTPELLEPDQECILVEGDTATCEANPELPTPDEESLGVDEEEIYPQTEHEQSIPDGDASAMIEQGTHPGQIALEPIKDYPDEREESFGHALIDPSERRYKTRFSERQRQALLSAPEIQETSPNIDNEDAFSEISIAPFTTASSDLRAFKISQEEVMGPLKQRGRRRKEVWRYVHEKCANVSEAVRRKSRRFSEQARD
jgi:hypothetical protein